MTDKMEPAEGQAADGRFRALRQGEFATSARPAPLSTTALMLIAAAVFVAVLGVGLFVF